MLHAAPDGLFAVDIGEKLGYSTSKEAGKMLNQLRLLGHIGSVREGCHHASARVRYFAPKHEATALAKNREGKGVTWGLGRASEAQKAAGFASGNAASGNAMKNYSLRAPAGEGIVTEKTKITRQSFPEDPRYHVSVPEKFFSALQYGSYLSTGSAIERAYT